jgi:ATP/maltotriose-dependent transcriptional regulator MalT/DNA-binding SARP family transcriptional activator
MTSSQPLQQNISSNKFYPPQVLSAASVFRSSLVTDILGHTACSRKAIIIEAQAGQGKSTLAAQFLHHFNLNFAWYQIGPEDADPVLLLSALLDNLQQKLTGFESPGLTYVLEQGEVGPLDINRCANILLTDLARHLAGDFYIVFDDLHFGEQAPLLNNLLSYIIDTSPPHLHFILISRRPLPLTAKTLRYGTSISILHNQDLRLSLEEVEYLFERVLKQHIPRKDAERIRQLTSGWIMGILLASHGINKHTPSLLSSVSSHTSLSTELSAEQLLDYFRTEILAHVPKSLHTTLVRLSLLNQFPLDLAETITGQKDIGDVLIELMRNNFFLYPLDEQQTVFRFHHLFREFLLERVHNLMSDEDVNNIYNTAAEYYLKKNSLEQALHCYRKEKNFSAMEKILRREGLSMMARNRTITLLGLLKSIPENQLLGHAWLTLFAGLLYSDFHPKKIQPLLESARNRFILVGEEMGELLALSYLIYFHFVVSGMYHTGALLLPRTEELFSRNRDNLPLHAQILIARNLGAGYCFFISRMKQARKYAKLAKDLATLNDIRNSIASSRFVCGYIESLTDNYRGCLQEIELSWPLLHDSLVGMSNKLTMRVLHLNYLSKHGDFFNFDNQQRMLQKSIDSQVVKQTVAAPYLYVWRCAGMVAAGRLEQAKELLQRGMKISATAQTPHMHSQFLQWQGYIHALQGNTNEALERITEATELRQLAGGPFYNTFCEILYGSILTRIEIIDQAEELLTTALRKAKQLPSDYMAAAALLQRSWLYRQSGREKEMLVDLRAGLECMDKNGYTYFWSWEPGFMKELLADAFQNNILPEFAALLARKHHSVFFTPTGSILPILKISILGPFSIRVEHKTLLTAEDLTPAQRSLMALILSEKNQRVSQEKIQLALWPDSSPEKSRAKLDTLLMRLRKVLGKTLPCPVSNYLSMQKGILGLDNCRIDGIDFSCLAREGLTHARAEHFWQAGNSFYKALHLWETVPASGSDLFRDETEEFYNQLILLLTRVGHDYGKILAELDCMDEAIKILTRVLQANQMDDQLITQLYGLYISSGQMLKGKETLIRYRQALRDQEYSEDEIDDLLFRVASEKN